MKLLLYCTKARLCLTSKLLDDLDDPFLNGKIVAECDCNEIEFIYLRSNDPFGDYFYDTNNLSESELLNESCLTDDELYDYLGLSNGYALHLSNLKVFNIPKKINYYGLEKAPMNMCFKRYPVPYDNELGGWEIDRETIIISVRPEHLCKILNGEKTIEIRKKILNELKRR